MNNIMGLASAVHTVEFDAELIGKLNQSGLHYASYPTADRFSDSYHYRDYLQAVATTHAHGGRHPFSIYIHIPFCDSVCYYCARNKIFTKNREKAAVYLGYLQSELDLLPHGVSAIGALAGTYSPKVKTLDAYTAHLERGELPIARGIKRSTDDLMRRFIIQMLMCNFELSLRSLEQIYPITFSTYFAGEIEKLRGLAELGLLAIKDDWISVTHKGRLLIRPICMVFDRWLRHAKVLQSEPLRYSITI